MTLLTNLIYRETVVTLKSESDLCDCYSSPVFHLHAARKSTFHRFEFIFGNTKFTFYFPPEDLRTLSFSFTYTNGIFATGMFPWVKHLPRVGEYLGALQKKTKKSSRYSWFQRVKLIKLSLPRLSYCRWVHKTGTEN